MVAWIPGCTALRPLEFRTAHQLLRPSICPSTPARIDPEFVEGLAGVVENNNFGNGVTKGDNWCLQHPNRGDKAVHCRCDEIAFSI